MNYRVRKSCLVLISILCYFDGIQAQDFHMSLWNDKVPNSKEVGQTEIIQNRGIKWVSKVINPTLDVFLPAERQRTDIAVVICPGGGYAGLAYDWEGMDIAKWMNGQGIIAIVLKYRLPDSTLQIHPHLAPLQDVQRAIRVVRHKAKEWRINPERIGVMGFSAGGHVAASSATHFNDQVYKITSAIDTLSARPDFLVLIYPVISMEIGITHTGSRNNLIGQSPDSGLVNYFSNELNITLNTPPTFLIHSGNDKAVPVENSLKFYQALLQFDIPVEMHLFPDGGHGYALAIGNAHLQQWPRLFASWLNNYIKPD